MTKPEFSGFSKKTESKQKLNQFERQEAKAEQLIQAGKVTEAASIYQNLIRKYSGSYRAYGNLAAILELQGDPKAALPLLKQALKLNPDYSEGHFNLGNSLKSIGDLDGAIRHYHQAIELQPKYSEALSNLGICLSLKGDRKSAIEAFRQAQRLEPDNASKNYNLGKALHQDEQHEEAISLYQAAIKLQPHNPSCRNSLGICLQEINKLDEAAEAFRQAISEQPSNAKLHYNLGIALHKRGSLDDCIKAFERALSLAPNNSAILNNLGISQKENGNTEAAIKSFQAAIRLQPNLSEAHLNLGIALQLINNTEAAIHHFRSALACNPSHTGSLNNLGNIFQEQEKLDEAIECFRQASAIETENPEFHYNLANALKLKGNLTDAIQCYRKALELRGDHAETHFNLALALLLNGDYSEGWHEYRWLRKTDQAAAMPATPPCRPWDGDTSLDGHPLLVISEQGLGDTLQFMRYIPILRHQTLELRFCASKKLHPLIKSSGIDPDPLTAEQANDINQGFWIPLLSLPGLLGVTPNNPLATEAYLHADQQQIHHWESIFASQHRPLIGLNWQGNPAPEIGSLRGRSAPLESLAAIAQACPGTLISLQEGHGSEQLEYCSFRHQFCELQNQISAATSLSETAAIVANCDLVITTDTAMAHLAGGMGIPTWVLLHQPPEWRWSISGSSSFWYPSVKLFRQEVRGDWTSLAEKVANELSNTLLY